MQEIILRLPGLQNCTFGIFKKLSNNRPLLKCIFAWCNIPNHGQNLLYFNRYRVVLQKCLKIVVLPKKTFGCHLKISDFPPTSSPSIILLYRTFIFHMPPWGPLCLFWGLSNSSFCSSFKQANLKFKLIALGFFIEYFFFT